MWPLRVLFVLFGSPQRWTTTLYTLPDPQHSTRPRLGPSPSLTSVLCRSFVSSRHVNNCGLMSTIDVVYEYLERLYSTFWAAISITALDGSIVSCRVFRHEHCSVYASRQSRRHAHHGDRRNLW